MRSCTPEPMNTDNAMGPNVPLGGRNTSPCTNFQPLSSTASSNVASLYRAMSLHTTRTMIMATMHVSNTTTNTELVMENQCTPSSEVLVR